jgi:transposase
MRAYSLDLRERIVRAVRRGQRPEAVAAQFEVSVWTVKRYLQRAEEGRLAASPIPGRPREIGAGQEEALRAQWRGAPDAPLGEHCDAWSAAHGARVHPTTMSRSLARLGWSRKKRSSTPPSGTTRHGSAGGAT